MSKKTVLATEGAGELDSNAAAAPVVEKRESIWKDVIDGIVSNKAALVSAFFILVLVVIAVVTKLVPGVLPYDPYEQNLAHSAQGPSAEHWFGTDELGRDIFARLVHGARISLLVGVVAVAIALATGGTLGAIAGYFGGKVDSIIMRGLDIFMSVPDILFTMAVVFALGANTVNLVIALTLAYFTNYVRLVRSQILSLSDLEYSRPSPLHSHKTN